MTDENALPLGAPALAKVRFSAARWVLAPVTTRRAARIAEDFGPGMDARTAWALARLWTHPDEVAHALGHFGDRERAGPF